MFFSLVFVMPFLLLFICALWSPAGKGWPLGSRLWGLTVNGDFPIGILGQVCYLIVLILDLCTLTYFLHDLMFSIPDKYFQTS